MLGRFMVVESFLIRFNINGKGITPLLMEVLQLVERFYSLTSVRPIVGTCDFELLCCTIQESPLEVRNFLCAVLDSYRYAWSVSSSVPAAESTYNI